VPAYIKYRKIEGYKYQLMEKYVHETGWTLDGPSGPTIDTKSFMRGSLVHDGCYQLMREKLLPQNKRKPADVILWLVCIADGMSRTRADYVYHAVRTFGGRSARPPKKPKQVIIRAP
jgi:hypothetical protein